MPKKQQAINYTSRDFDSIRRDLETYAKRYYPNTYQDFSEASFGSLMLDTVSYIGDILSFYVDYQANEGFLDTAIQYDNVVNLSRQFGFRLPASPASFGTLTFYIKVPVASAGAGPDLDFAPTLRAGSDFASSAGGLYTLLEDVNFASINNQVVVAAANSTTGAPQSYIIRALGRAMSGRTNTEEITVGEFQRFLKVPLSRINITDVLSVTDTEGHQYYQVENLSQNIIYKAIRNSGANSTAVPNLLKAVPVPRRFVLEQRGNESFLQFGYGSDSELLSNSVLDPSELMLDLNGKNYISDLDFDPVKLISTDKFGVAPANTKLRINYRYNTGRDVNAAIGTITVPQSPSFKFSQQATLSLATRNSVQSSLELTNEAPFVGNISMPSSEEIKQRTMSYFAAQNRAVTVQDYQAIIYGMPGKFGAVHRAQIVKDFKESQRNLNLYVVSKDTSGKLTPSNTVLKNNLKTWISQYKMINDTVDILDTEIVNFGINYIISLDANSSRYTVINRANRQLVDFYNANQFDIGESIQITDIYRELQKVKGILDVYSVEIVEKTGGLYSNSNYDVYGNLSADGNMIVANERIIFELKFPNVDIKGSIR